MVKKSVVYAVCLSVLCGLAGAIDKTPYKFLFMGNGYSGPRNVTVDWLAERYDVGTCGMGDWPNLLDSIYDVCRANGKEFKWGPYASSQQINMYIAGGASIPYSERIIDTVSHWQYIYAKHYLDSIGVSPESLVVHVADDMWAQTQQWDGYRRIVTTDLPHHKRRWTYQHWNNVPGDYFYPAGYAWLANGYNEDARRAIAYAYRRHFIEDSARVGHGKGHWTAYFMDNQYRNSGTLGAYYSVDSTRGGPNIDQMDWVEQPAIHTKDTALYYFDNSTLMIDSVIMAVLDSACDASGIDRILGFANINKFSYIHLQAVLPYLRGVFLERPTGLTRSWPYENGWDSWYKMADIMAANSDKYIIWYFGAESLCSSNPSDWNYDSSRIYLFHHAFFLQVRDTNAYVCPARFNDSTRWREIYEVDFGEPDSAAWEISNNGYPNTSYSKIAVMGRTYDDGNVFTLVRTTSGAADFVNDSVAVNLHALYREIDANADTSLTADSIFYMKPFMGKILFSADACAAPPSVPEPLSPVAGSSVESTRPTLCVINSDKGACDNPVNYHFEVSLNSTFTQVILQSGWISEGPGTTCYSLSSSLDTGHRYYWRCRATNGAAVSSWSTSTDFTTPNAPPPAPSGISPADQSIVSDSLPELTINNVADPDGTPVVYYFQLSISADFSALVAQSGSVSPGAGTTTWRISVALEDGITYFWRARAFDDLEYGQWMTPFNFTVSIETPNNPPSTPAVSAPSDSVVVTELPVELRWNNSSDADNDSLVYHVQLFDSSGTLTDEASAVNEGSGLTSSFAVSSALQNDAWYNWRVRAFDGLTYSSWSVDAVFFVDTLYGTNLPPEPPVLTAPNDFDTLSPDSVLLMASAAYDPESDPLSYDFILLKDSANGDMVDSISNITQMSVGADIIWPVSAAFSHGQKYFWSCRANDSDNYSEWAPHYCFWVLFPGDDDTGTVDSPPVADFGGDPTSGVDSLTVDFSDLSANDPTSWLWDFGDGTTSNLQNPSHTFSEAGMFTVSLTATNAYGSDTRIKVDYIDVTRSQTYWQAFALSESTTRGSVAGDFSNTVRSDDIYESLTEVDSETHSWKSFSMLEHQWFFTVTSANWVTFYVEAFRSDNSDGDNFTFEYSTDDSLFVPLVTISSAAEKIYSAPLPDHLGGDVTVRIVDTDQSKGNQSMDMVSVDYMYIESSGIPPAPDTMYVHSIDVLLTGGAIKKHAAQATIEIRNQHDAPVVGAIVSGHYSGPSNESVSGITGGDGTVAFSSANVGRPIGQWYFSVDDVNRENSIYASELNIENKDYVSPSDIDDPAILDQNHPNPFNPATEIGFVLRDGTEITVAVYNILGQQIASLVNGYMEPGYHIVEWTGKDDDGRQVASGVYFYRLQAEDFAVTRKMVLLK